MNFVLNLGPWWQFKIKCKFDSKLFHRWSKWSSPQPALYGMRFIKWRSCEDCHRLDQEYVNEDGSPEVRLPPMARELPRNQLPLTRDPPLGAFWCFECGGTGRWYFEGDDRDYECSTCKGTGVSWDGRHE